MSNKPNTPKKTAKARQISEGDVGEGSEKQRATQTFQLLNFPVQLANTVNATADYLGIKRLDFVVRILEAALQELEVNTMQQKLKEQWTQWCNRHKGSES